MRPIQLLALAAAAPAALAQCDPAWVPGPGADGLRRGYAQPALSWDDGSGEALYVGGSFTNVGGFGYQGLARWNPADGTWSRPGTGLSFGSTNGFVTSLAPFDTGSGEILVVGGFFESAGGVADTQSLAAWDGTDWLSLGSQFVRPEAVWSLTVGDLGDGQKLYLAGGFLQVGGVPASGVAAWDGQSFEIIGEGSGMDGFSPFVADTAVWDDGSGPALYAVGRFNSIDGVSSPLAARFVPGSGWEEIGAGLFGQSSTTTLNAVTVFDDGTGEKLYIAGSPFRASGGAFASVYRWDGSSWAIVGQDVGGRVTDLRVWDDGSGPTLYMSGTATPDINYLARLENGIWEIYLEGVGGPAVPPSNFPSVFGLGEYGDDLVVCGNFTLTGDGQSAAGIAIVESCASGCVADFNNDGTVNSQDVIAFLNAWASGDASADIDGNGAIDTRDVIQFLGLWTTGC